jgi:hypothetical protein
MLNFVLEGPSERIIISLTCGISETFNFTGEDYVLSREYFDGTSCKVVEFTIDGRLVLNCYEYTMNILQCNQAVCCFMYDSGNRQPYFAVGLGSYMKRTALYSNTIPNILHLGHTYRNFLQLGVYAYISTGRHINKVRAFRMNLPKLSYLQH